MRDLPAVLLRAVDATAHGIVIADAAGDQPVVYANPAFLTMTGYPAGEVMGRNCRFLQGPDTEALDLAAIRNALQDGSDITTVLRNYRRDGSAFWNEVTISAVRHPGSNRMTHFVGTHVDVTDRVERDLELRASAGIDPVTGLSNVGRLSSDFDVLVAEMPASHSAVLVFVDLIDFHLVNENLDFNTGSLVLAVVAERLSGVTRATDLLARLGSDHFALVRSVPTQEHAGAAQQIIDTVDCALDAPIATPGLALPIRANCGAATYPQDGAAAEELIRSATTALQRQRRVIRIAESRSQTG